MRLGIDHEHARRRDHNVIDVAACARYSSIMENPNALDAVQRLGEFLFAL